MSFYYSVATGKVYSADQMLALFGYNTAIVSIGVLNGQGFYPVVETTPDFDTQLYTYTYTWNLVSYGGGQGAEKVYTPVARPLATAISNGSTELKTATNNLLDNLLATYGVNDAVVSAVASQLAVSRPVRFQVILDAMTTFTNKLHDQLNAVDVATTVDEVNNVVNPPTGEITLSRTGDDLDAAVFASFTSLTLTEAGTELYVPGTATTISWSGTDFPATVSAFTTGDYEIQLRQVANGLVISTFEVTTTPTNYDF